MRRLGRGVVGVATMCGALALVACSSSGPAKTPTATVVLETPTPPPPATPPCEGERRVTPATTEGANFVAGSPERTSLIEPGISGTKLTVTGTVLSTDCRAVAGALLDFWQADETGAYDAGTRLRGRQTTGADGRYKLETIIPGLEPGHARTIHVKVQSPVGVPLTTQLFFAGEKTNAGDPAFVDALAMDVQVEGGEKVGGYDFVLQGR